MYRTLTALEKLSRRFIMEEKKRHSFKEYSEQISKIEQATDALNRAVQEMPICSARKTFELSIKNLYKKISKVTPEGKTLMTDEEKELLKKFREGKITFTEAATSPIKEKENEVPSAEFTEPKIIFTTNPAEPKIVKKSKKH